MFMSAKRLIFDSLFFTYTFLLLAHALFLVANLAGFTDTAPSQDFFLRNFSSVAYLVLSLWLFSLMISAVAAKTNFPTVGDALFATNQRKQQLTDRTFFQSFWGLHVSLVLIGSILVSFQITNASLFEILDPDGLGGAWRLWTGLTDPNFSILPKAILEAVETIFIAFLATVFAIPVAFLLAFFCAKNIMTHPVAVGIYATLRLIMNISRSIEAMIWALIFTVWVGVGPFAGMLALMIHSIASLAKLYSEILESVNEGPIEGLRSTGANQIQVIWFAVVPQIVLPYIGMTIYRWDTNVRMATVIGLVGGGGIGTLLIQYQGQAMWPEVGCIVVVIAFIVWLMDVASAYVREALK
jgi:phosphonate transport system permease protein